MYCHSKELIAVTFHVFSNNTRNLSRDLSSAIFVRSFLQIVNLLVLKISFNATCSEKLNLFSMRIV